MNKKPSSRVVLCTCPTPKANGLARQLLEERLVSRVSVVPGVTGLYGFASKATVNSGETLLVMRADRRRVKFLEARLGEMLPTRELLNVSTRRGSEPYMTWMIESAAC